MQYYTTIGHASEYIFEANEGPDHSRLSPEELRNQKYVIEAFHATLLAATKAVLSADMRPINRRRGLGVAGGVAWSCTTESNMQGIALRTAEAIGTRMVRKPLPDEWAGIREHSEWGEAWTGGYDVMHLADHVLIPVYEPPAPSRLMIGEAPTATRSGSAVLMLDGYIGWYRTLHTLGAALPTAPGMRSWRVDVVCRPLGWLGTYRQSRSTGRWFAGRHRWHELGVP